MAVNIQKYGLRLVKEAGGRYELDKIIRNPHQGYVVFTEVLELDKRTEEVFAIITLDIKNQVTGVFEVSAGNLSSTLVTPREVFKRAILNNARAVILGHNHPSGMPEPSKDDIKITEKLRKTGEIIGIEVLDHIIIGGTNNYLSMKEEELI